MPKVRPPTVLDAALLLVLMFVVVEAAQMLVDYLTLAGEAIRYPYPLNYGEGPVLEQTLRLARGETIYAADFAGPPYRVTAYPPLFHLVQVPFVTANGPAFGYGRAVSLIAALTAAAFVALTAHRLTADWIASGVAAVLLLAFPHIGFWSLFNRVDTLALALSLAGLWVVVRWPGQWFGVAVAVVLFVAAIYTKHSYALAGPATAGVWLWSQHRRRPALALAGGVAGGAAVLFAVLDLVTAGGFHRHILLANLVGFELYLVVGQLVNVFVHGAFIIIGGIVFLLLERTAEPTRSWHFVLLYAVFALLPVMLAGKPGSDVHYAYELIAALSLLAAAALAWMGRHPAARIVALIVIAVQLTDLRDWTKEAFQPIVTGKMALRREVAQLDAMIRQANGDVLADEFMGLLPLNGRRIFIQPFEFTRLQEVGMWNEAVLVDAINRKSFVLIALYEPMNQPALIVQRWSPRVRQAIYANYTMANRLAEALIYVPR